MKRYIKNFIDDLNYHNIVLDITEVDPVSLRQRLNKDYVNHLYEMDEDRHIQYIHIENCDLQGHRTLSDVWLEKYELFVLHEDEGGFCIEDALLRVPVREPIVADADWYTYDTEVFAHDFIVVFKNWQNGERIVTHNDNGAVKAIIDRSEWDNAIFCGFNSKGYDQYIIKAICAGFTPEEVKAVNDFIIKGGQGWQCPLLNGVYYRFNNVDVMDDMQMGLSLKAIEGHLGLSIEETEVDFNLDRPLTKEELDLTVKYCIHDVDCTEHLTDIRRNYLANKIYLGRLKEVEEVKSLSMTNAKLTALYVDAQRHIEYTDEREYKYPDNLLRDYIPAEVFEFFDRLYDRSISDDDLFKSKLNISVGECPVTLGFGGIHGAIPFYQEQEQDGRIIRNYDVASYYPHLMTICGYTSRNIPEPQIYADMLETRMKAKKAGDIATANALKLVANTTYGAMLNKYNDLFDPLMGRSVCISGQLFLLELSRHLISECSTLKIVQLNTDGIMVSFHESEYDTVLAITKEWQERTGFELEEDKIRSITQKDVNNYVEIPTGDLYDKKGKPRWKIKGGYLVRGIAPAGAFNINNNATIVAKAIVDYFVHGTPPEETINGCDDIFAFQLIAKAGAKYREAYHLVDGEPQSVQKVNRVYATADERYGKLFKVKAENDATAKIEMLPEHCIIDNDNHLTIEDVDKAFYIEMARKRINDFLGIKPEKNKRRKPNMATTNTTAKDKTMNVYQKLLKARAKFLGSDTKKSGKNMTLAFKYFELDDIVPVATKIFEELGLIALVNFNEDKAFLTVVNTDSTDESIVFTAPMVSAEGNKAVNPVQAFGATVTYYRRYLYMMALDICEPDNIEPTINGNTSAPAVTAPATTAPTTAPAAKSTIPVVTSSDKPLTNGNSNASETQIRQLKDLLIKLKDKDPSKEEMIAQIAVQTQGFTVISKADCETLVIKIGEMLNTEGK